MADFDKPTLTSRYDTQFIQEVKALITALCTRLFTSDTHVPTDTIRFDRARRRWQTYNGATWVDLDTEDAGCMKLWGNATPPDGWLICNGAAISRTTYAALFTNIGTTFGTGDGSTTFNIPDFRGRFPLGKAAAGTGSTLGGTGGNIDHTHSQPAHYHTKGTGATLSVDINHDHAAVTSGASSGHTHSIDPPAFTGGTGWVSNDHAHVIDVPAFSGSSGAGSAHSHGIHNKWDTSTTHSHSGQPALGAEGPSGPDGDSWMNTAGESAHTHGIDHDHGSFTSGGITANHYHTINHDHGSFTSGGESGHTHSVDVAALGATAVSPTGSIGLVTGGVDGNSAMTSGANNPPFQTVNFIIKT